MLDDVFEKVLMGSIFFLFGAVLAVFVALFDLALNPLTKTSPTLAESHTKFLPYKAIYLEHYTPIGTTSIFNCRNNSATIYQSTVNLTEQITICD